MGAAPLREHAHRIGGTACRRLASARTPGRSSVTHWGDDETVVIFSGSGSTGAIDKLIGMMGLRLPAELDDRYGLADRSRRRAAGRLHRTVRAPLQRAALAGVDRRLVIIPRRPNGHIDPSALERSLARRSSVKIGSFSAAINVTGIVSDTRDSSCSTGTAPFVLGLRRGRRRTSISTMCGDTVHDPESTRTRSS